MMYDELVKSLRICSKCDFGQNCWGCKQKSDDVFCCDKLLHEAADAIEDLIVALTASNEVIAKSKKSITNADRIRSMTDEELAEWFYFSSLGFHYNQEEMLNWLKQECES